MSFCGTAQAFGIMKSTLCDHYSCKAKGSRRCPTPYLSEAEEQELADWAIEMGRIGYGCTREQILTMVKKLLEKDGWQNLSFDNLPRKDWLLLLARLVVTCNVC